MPEATVLGFGVIVTAYLFAVIRYGFTNSKRLRPLLVRGHRSCGRKLFHRVCKLASVVLFLCLPVIWQKGWVTLGRLFFLIEIDCILFALQFQKHRWKLALAEWNFVGIREDSIDVIAQVARQVGFEVEENCQDSLCQLYSPSGKMALESVYLGHSNQRGFYIGQEPWVKELLEDPSLRACLKKRVGIAPRGLPLCVFGANHGRLLRSTDR